MQLQSDECCKTIFHVGSDLEFVFGVYGDGDNGIYEWFLFDHGTLKVSQCSYGSPVIALRDVLAKVLEEQ